MYFALSLFKQWTKSPCVGEVQPAIPEPAEQADERSVYQCTEYCAQLYAFEYTEAKEDEGENYSQSTAAQIVDGLDFVGRAV